MRRYGAKTRVLASALLPFGWVAAAWAHHPLIDSALSVGIASAFVALVVILSVLTIRSIPGGREAREPHIVCSLVPALAAAALLVFLAAPVADTVGLAL